MNDENWGVSPAEFRMEKTFLDPVHGDIGVTLLERRVIDTRPFQRLRGVKQLGTSDLVYHGARHDRFAHSLGTMHVADEMVLRINSRAELLGNAPPISVRAHRLTRLAALLHDIGHAPYGHQLEDEFPILQKHDRPERYEQLLGSGTEIGKVLGETLSQAIISVLGAKDDDQIAGLEFPFISDIVGNTVCADLLDYARRDVHHTGLEKRSGTRMLKYLGIGGPDDGEHRGRVVLDAWKANHVRYDVLSDILDLLDVRLALSERVLFHHTKLASGAMLARAVADSSIPPELVADMRDDELLFRLRDDPSESTRRLADDLLIRKLYKSIWLTPFESVGSGGTGEIKLVAAFNTDTESTGYAARKVASERRRKFEDDVTRELGLELGTVLVSCPSPPMLFKAADVRVRIDGTIARLRDVPIPRVTSAVENLKAGHRALWRFDVFVAPEVAESRYGEVCGVVSDRLNDMGIRVTNNDPRGRRAEHSALVDGFIARHGAKWVPPISAEERLQLLPLAARGEGEAPLDDRLAGRLAQLRAPAQGELGMKETDE